MDAQDVVNLKRTRGHVLLGYTFLNLTSSVMHIEDCLAKCLQDCRCMSFQICRKILCQLCSTDASLNPSALKKAIECNHFQQVPSDVSRGNLRSQDSSDRNINSPCSFGSIKQPLETGRCLQIYNHPINQPKCLHFTFMQYSIDTKQNCLR